METSVENIKIFAGNSNRKIASEICSHLNLPLGRAEVSNFSDGEINVSFYESVRGCNVFIVQSTCSPVSDNLMELLLMIDACKRASARKITAVIPYFGYSRQDRKAKNYDPISAKLIADLISCAGANRVITMDLHTPQIQGFFNIPVDDILGANVMTPYFFNKFKDKNSEITVVSPDIGSVPRARKFAESMNASLAIIDKRRQRANVSEVMNIIGDVKDKIAIIIDDMIDTAGTVCEAAKTILKNGKAREIYVGATHGILSGNALKKFMENEIKEIVFLDTIPINIKYEKLKVLSSAKTFANMIKNT